MPRGPETPIPIRAGILALHLFTDMNWVDISTKFLVHPDTAKKICQRAKERAADDTVNALFAALGDAERTGRPRKHVDGTVGEQRNGGGSGVGGGGQMPNVGQVAVEYGY